MMIKKFLITVLILISFQKGFSQIPTGYYDSANGLSGNSLKSALHNIIDDHTEKTYDDLWTILKESDEDPDNSSNFILIYTGRSISKSSVYPDFNREHVWAKSHGDFGTTPPAGTDAHHLRPSDVSVNSDRGNKDFDNGGTQHTEATECYWDSDSWEPRDAVKGDVARMMFYMAVRYEGDVSGEPDLELVDYITGSTSSPIFGKLSTLLEWHNQDPVDDFERNRNEVVYSYQNNRNPFVDSSQYVARIWGGSGNSLPSITNIIEDPSEPTSSDDVSISATITDTDGTISSAELRWGLSTGSLSNTIQMSVSMGDIYVADTEIPAQSNGTIVYYEIEATDDNSESNTSTVNTFVVSDVGSSNDLLDEDFSICPATHWTTYSVSGTRNWECGMGYMEINAYGSDVACDDWLISPVQNLNAYENEVLSFKSWNKYADNYYPPIEIKYSVSYTGSGDPGAASWNTLSATWCAENDQVWTSSGNIDISAISGTDVYFAFHYTSSGTGTGTSAYWEVDDVLITGDEITNKNPQISNIGINPTSPLETEDVSLSATITDEDGTIASSEIQWGTTSGNHPNKVSMSYSGSNDIYSGIIPKQVGGTAIYYLVEATDNNGGINRSNENSFVFTAEGNNSPQISDISYYPTSPQSDESVNVSATIIDTDGTISIAEIHWGTAPDSYPNTSLLTGTSNNYNGQIPEQNKGTQIYFIIYAVDEDGGSAQTTAFNYTVEDENLLPEISDVSFDPTNPVSTDIVGISAIITDSDGSIAEAKVKWGISTAAHNNEVIMTNTSDSYFGVIPAQDDGTIIYFIVEAKDNESALVVSSEFNYTVFDGENQAPVISDVNISPNNPTQNDHVIVSCLAEDSDGSISNVLLKWKLESSSYSDLGMNLSGGKYYGQIPKQSIGEKVYFSIVAEDNENLQKNYDSTYTVSLSNGIKGSTKDFIKIYPIPAGENLYLEIDHFSGKVTISIYDIVGTVVKTEEIEYLNQYKIDMNDLDTGIYFISFVIDNELITKRILIEN